MTPEQPRREVPSVWYLGDDAEWHPFDLELYVSGEIHVALSTQQAELERVTKERDALRDKVEKAKVFVESDLAHFDRGFRIERIVLESLDALLKEKP